MLLLMLVAIFSNVELITGYLLMYLFADRCNVASVETDWLRDLRHSILLCP